MSTTSSTDSNSPPPPPPTNPWTEQDELRLLKSVREIADEPVKSFDPTVNLFSRLGKSLNKPKPFSNKEILAKVKDLKTRYEADCFQIRRGKRVGALDSPVFELSHAIWGRPSSGSYI